MIDWKGLVELAFYGWASVDPDVKLEAKDVKERGGGIQVDTQKPHEFA